MSFHLEIEKIVPPGDGLGYYNGKAVFVPCTTIGDVVEVTIVKEKKRHIHASLKKVNTPGKDRIQAPCPHYQECGGCSLMHLSYDDQVNLKKKLLSDVFANHGLDVSPGFVPSPQTNHYRYRTTIKLKDGIIGFSTRQSHSVVPIEGCLILSHGIKKQLNGFKNQGRNNCEFSLLESSANGEIAVCVTERNRLVPLPGHSVQVTEDYGYGPLLLRSDGFAQANPFVTSAICQSLEKEVSVNDRICELYCGAGTFSLSLAKKAKALEGFDFSKKSIQAAIENAKKSKLTNTQFHVANLEKSFKMPQSNTIVVDPPRKGLGNVPIKRIGNSAASKLLYVSCNPASLARDVKNLIETYRFSLLSVTGYDMYCHSNHVEVVAVLAR